jgi:hypothetical protein
MLRLWFGFSRPVSRQAYVTTGLALMVGYLSSRHGEFRLSALPGGGTRLEGVTRYTLRIFPSWYWSRWADAIIHRIHMRVLRHLRSLVEDRRS